jgi:hypothetical protein
MSGMKAFSFVALELALVVLAVAIVAAAPAVFEEHFTGVTADEDLSCAAWTGEEERFEVALQGGGSIFGRDGYGATPLHYAALSGNASLVARLVALGADVNAENHGGVTPLMNAASNDDVAVAGVLLRGGARANDRTLDAAMTADAHDVARLLRQWRNRPPEVKP